MKLAGLAFVFAILLMSSSVRGNNVTDNQTAQALAQAEKDIKEMSDAGFGVVFVNDAMLEAKKAFNAALYSLAIEKTQLISERKLQAYNISDSLTALNFGIDELEGYNLNTSKVKELLNKSKTAFLEERYEETERLIKQGYTGLTNVRAEATLVQVRIKAVRDNIISFVRDNQTNIVIGGIVVAIVTYFVLSKIMAIRTKNRIKDLETEKLVLTNLMKKAQSEHFKKGILTRESYEIKMNKYKERVLEIKELVPVLKARVKKK